MSKLPFLAGAAALALLSLPAAAQDYRQPFHPDQLKGPPAGALNEVLVSCETSVFARLKTQHIAQVCTPVMHLTGRMPHGFGQFVVRLLLLVHTEQPP